MKTFVGFQKTIFYFTLFLKTIFKKQQSKLLYVFKNGKVFY